MHYYLCEASVALDDGPDKDFFFAGGGGEQPQGQGVGVVLGVEKERGIEKMLPL